jgi:hypothetical protein
MRRRIIGLLVVAGTLGAPRGASADQADGTGAVILLGFDVLDAGLALTDLGALANHAWLPRVYGGFEAAAAGTQVALLLDGAVSNQPNGGFGTGMVLATGLGAILMAHGIVTLVGPRSHAESPGSPGLVTVAPVALSDVTRVSVPGLAVLGRF